MKKIQREKIDLLINRACQKINNKIWKYNKSVSYPKNQERFILKTITLSTREFIIEHIMGQI